MIPEFMGRLPIIVSCDALDVAALTRVLYEPKNSGALGEAQKDVEEAGRLAPQEPDVVFVAADLAQARQDVEKARTILSEGIKAHPDNPNDPT